LLDLASGDAGDRNVNVAGGTSAVVIAATLSVVDGDALLVDIVGASSRRPLPAIHANHRTVVEVVEGHKLVGEVVEVGRDRSRELGIGWIRVGSVGEIAKAV
jgi:hypothetical protein